MAFVMQPTTRNEDARTRTLSITFEDTDAARWSMDAVAGAKVALVQAIVDGVMEVSREQIMGHLTPEAIAQSVKEGLAIAVAEIVKKGLAAK